jgi:hypothetical protein
MLMPGRTLTFYYTHFSGMEIATGCSGLTF